MSRILSPDFSWILRNPSHEIWHADNLFNVETARKARHFHRQLPSFRQTPLCSLAELTRQSTSHYYSTSDYHNIYIVRCALKKNVTDIPAYDVAFKSKFIGSLTIDGAETTYKLEVMSDSMKLTLDKDNSMDLIFTAA